MPEYIESEGMIMLTCNDCLHQELCDFYAQMGVTDVPADDITVCDAFKNKADVVEVRHGMWWVQTDIADYPYGTCSVCGYVEWDAFPRGDIPNYCPNCGADMRGEKK